MFPPVPAALSRKHLFHKAKLAEGAKRYDHMLFFMKQIVEATHPKTDITPRERCLLGAAFRNFVAHPRDSLRLATLTTQSWTDPFSGPLAESYLLKSKEEILDACTETLQLIELRLLPVSSAKEAKVFYLTLKGDFSWYLAELKGQSEGMLDEVVSKATYMEAWAIATDLPSMNPHRLALEFSMAEYFFEYLKSPLQASISVDRAMNVPELIEPEKKPAASLLSFEGGFQMVANLISMKRRLHNALHGNEAGPSNAPAAPGPSNAPAAPGPSHFPLAPFGPSNAPAAPGPSHFPLAPFGPSNAPAAPGPSHFPLAPFGPSNFPAAAGPSKDSAAAGPSHDSAAAGPSNDSAAAGPSGDSGSPIDISP